MQVSSKELGVRSEEEIATPLTGFAMTIKKVSSKE